MRVPAGFMRNQTQERIEELARERAATAIDLALVEDGIEIGKKMMAEMIATYQAPGKSPAAAPSAAAPARKRPRRLAAPLRPSCPGRQRERQLERGEPESADRARPLQRTPLINRTDLPPR